MRRAANRVFQIRPAVPGERLTATEPVAATLAAQGLRGNYRNDPPYGGSRNG